MPKGEKLTLKQREWLKIYLETGNATEAAIKAYEITDDNRHTAANIGYENVIKLDYSEFLEAAGVTDKLLQEKLLEGLAADKPFGKGADIHADYSARHKFLETALKLKKRLTDRIDITSGEEPIPILPLPAHVLPNNSPNEDSEPNKAD